MSIESPTPVRIDVDSDILVTDAEFCRTVLGGVHRRTAKRLEHEGLPYILLGGRKYRPLAQGRAWLASRIKVRNASPQRRRS
jgi:hypothetical protein